MGQCSFSIFNFPFFLSDGNIILVPSYVDYNSQFGPFPHILGDIELIIVW